MSIPDGFTWDAMFKSLYEEMKKHTTDNLIAIGQFSEQAMEEINQQRDFEGRLSQLNEIAYNDYALYIQVIDQILTERGIFQ